MARAYPVSAGDPLSPSSSRRSRGSVLIIVLWVCLGLVSLTLYFANAMSTELRAADNRMQDISARQAVAAGIRYAQHVLKTYAVDGVMPRETDYLADAVPVGDARFWFIGRDNDLDPASSAPREPYFGLIDEASKLNLNTATRAVLLAALPANTENTEIIDSILAWRTATAANSSSSADGYYIGMDPPRRNKGALFETVDELRLVYGATLDILIAEDTNRNGVLDANEDDGALTAPRDDQNGQLLTGLLDRLTIYTRQANTSAESAGNRIDIRTAQSRQAQTIRTRLTTRGIAEQRINQIIQATPNNATYTSVAQYMIAAQYTADEWALVRTDFTATDGGTAQGLINICTAPPAVLAAIPGIGEANAALIFAYRQSNRETARASFHWISQVLSPAAIAQAGPFITDQTYQFSADIAAVGAHGRGYCRERVVFDMTTGTPRIVYRQDLSAQGWALGQTIRRDLRPVKGI